MNHLKNSQNNTNPITHTAGAREATWDDELPLDHHIEELLGVFSAVGRSGPYAPADASA